MVTINSAESNRAQLLSIPEVTWGTTPGSGTVKTLRILNSGISATKDTKMSEEIRADRMVSSIVETAASTGGDVKFEVAAGSFDDFMQAFLLGAWTKTMNWFQVKGTSVSITGVHEVTITGADWTDWLADNQWLKLEGFLTAGNNIYVSVNGAPSYSGGNTVITVDQTVAVEAGSAYTRIFDANDVHSVATTVTFTSGNTVDGGGANAYAGLKVGQRVWIEGLGKETGTIQAIATDPAEGDTIVISDGVDTITLEIRTNSALVTPGNVHVALSGTPATLAASISAAIMDQFRRKNVMISCTVSTDTVTLTNHRQTGGSISSASGGITETNFSGGSATKGGFYTVASVPDNDTFTTVETLSTDANAGSKKVIVKGSHVRNPGVVGDITKQSFSMETGFTDVAKYFSHDGLRVGGFDFNVQTGEILNMSFSFKGRETATEPSGTALGNTGTYTVLPATSTEPLNATSNVGTIYKDGTALDLAVMNIKIQGDANLREQRAVGEKFPAGIGYGRFALKGTLEVYFEDFTMFNAFLDHDTVSLEFDVTDADEQTYWFKIPAMKVSADPISPPGIDKDVMEPMEFMAFRDSSLQTMFMVTRFSSVWGSVG